MVNGHDIGDALMEAWVAGVRDPSSLYNYRVHRLYRVYRVYRAYRV